MTKANKDKLAKAIRDKKASAIRVETILPTKWAKKLVTNIQRKQKIK